MSSVGPGSLLCQVIDQRPISYLEHWVGVVSRGWFSLATDSGLYSETQGIMQAQKLSHPVV